MPIVTRKDFADLCGKESNYINTYIIRNKITTCQSGKMIDTENPLNKIFRKKCLDALKSKGKEVKEAPKLTQEERDELMDKVIDKEPEKIFTKPETATQRKQREKDNDSDKESTSWDLRKKIAEALKMEQQAERERLAVEKMMGKLMPVDLVKTILKINMQSVFKTFEASAMNLASIYCDIMAGGDRTLLAQITNELRGNIEESIKRASETAAQEIENVVEEYTETRNRGERK